MPTVTTREALAQASDILNALTIAAVDPALTHDELIRLLHGIGECHGTLIQLNGQNTLPSADRGAREASLMACVSSLNVVLNAHEQLPPEQLYNAVDLIMAVAGAIAEGEQTVTAGS